MQGSNPQANRFRACKYFTIVYNSHAASFLLDIMVTLFWKPTGGLLSQQRCPLRVVSDPKHEVTQQTSTPAERQRVLHKQICAMASPQSKEPTHLSQMACMWAPSDAAEGTRAAPWPTGPPAEVDSVHTCTRASHDRDVENSLWWAPTLAMSAT